MPLIFDTDIGNDVDDVLALGILNALQSRGACRLEAVTVTNPDPRAGAFAAAVDTFYGHGDIPIGVNPFTPVASKNKFLSLVTAVDGEGRWLYPSEFQPASAPAAVTVLRRILAAADERSVVIVQTGYFSNLAKLLASGGDDISPLNGLELVRRKVRLLSVMGGSFQPIGGKARYAEFNVRIDIPAAVTVARSWPSPIVWSGKEVGNAVLFPAAAVDHDFGWTAHNPLRDAYQLYRPTPHERPCWDVTSAFYAVFPDRGYFSLSEPGRVQVESDGSTRFEPAAGGRDRYLKVDRTQAAVLRAVFGWLASERP